MVLITLLLLLVTVGIFIEIFKTTPSSSDDQENNAFCAVIASRPAHYLIQHNDTINFNIGKSQFRNLCASCHNKSMKDDMVGPALGGAIKRFNYDTLRFASYVKNPEMYLQNTRDIRLESLHQKNGGMKKPAYESLTLNEVKSIIMYIETKY